MQAKATLVAMCIVLYNILGLFWVAFAPISHRRAQVREVLHKNCISSAQVVNARQTRPSPPLREGVATLDYLSRWSLALKPYKFIIQHRAGLANGINRRTCFTRSYIE